MTQTNIDLSTKKSELLGVVDKLDIHTSLVLMGVLLEHIMRLTGMQKKAESVLKIGSGATITKDSVLL